MIHTLNTLRVAALAAAALALSAGAATLSFDATMHTAADSSSEVVGTLPAGSSITPILREELAAAGLAEPPPGWIALRHTVELEGYVRSRDVGKDSAMKPDSPLFAEASESSPVLAIVGPKDPVIPGDPVGRYLQASLRKEQIVYVNSVPPASRAMTAVAAAPAASSTPEMKPLSSTTAPAPQAAPAPAQPPGPAVTAAPRTFEGYLMRTRRILGRGPKVDYQLVDENNRRIVLLDMSSLLVTEPIEFFEGRLVRVYGPGISQEGVTEALIRVENLRLAR